MRSQLRPAAKPITIPVMTHPAPPEGFLPPQEIPESFFRGLPDPVSPRGVDPTGTSRPTAPMRAMILYDAIIDYMFANPTAEVGEVSKALGKGRNTISLVVRSDFFRARWLQRREKFNEDLSWRISQKVTSVLEKSLDATAAAIDKKRDTIPLPVLKDINEGLLDRLGYKPSSGGAAPVHVNVHANSAAIANGGGGSAASPEAVAKAREYLSLLEAGNAASGARPGNASEVQGASACGPVVEGEVVGRSDAPSS